MILLALDTSDSRGSLAVLRDDEVLEVIAHESSEDYSSWVLPNVERVLASKWLKMQDVGVYAVSAGPGSFTGLRVGLTSVKAWSEVYCGKIASVSRLEAIASQAGGEAEFVAAFFNAQREQVFGGLFRRDLQRNALQPVDQELVIDREGFLRFVEERSAGSPVAWVSMDAEKLLSLDSWKRHADAGETIQASSHVLAPMIGKIGFRRAKDGQLVDALALDAQYVRRSDAETFWKGHAAR